eukprot:TRINITY_DN4113_c0_g1_i1.p1 TRINITY_DN4113_c0_g1~~TRINITY_DN4113_c0_g1_i1.p1  ORF type:complete len:432 (-),score=95.83 TRINITY_DN4113_c0_g1_i1:985-2280(-)
MESVPNVAQTSIDRPSFKEALLNNLQILDDANRRERELLNEVRNSLDAAPTRSLALITKEISTLLDHRSSSLKNLKDGIVQTNTQIAQSNVTQQPPRIRHPQLTFIQEPKEISFGDRMIVPSPVVQIDEISHYTNYNVRVALWFSSTDREVMTGDSSESALAGNILLPLEKDGTAHFSDLFVSDVGAKARRQSFILQFSLESIQEKNAPVAQLKSSSFVAQTRPSSNVLKRKSRDSNDEEQIWSKKPTEDVTASPPVKPKSSQSQPEYNYVDITDLLTLPQKEAAQRLHISESMLCKRFKECTRRKWPYRYLCKIDKVINLLYNQSEGQLSDEDKEKLDRLVQEREECLQPVRIRIIPHERENITEDASNASPPHASPQESPSASPLDSRKTSPTAPIKFSDEDVMVMHTLEMLKSQIPSHQSKNLAKRDP